MPSITFISSILLVTNLSDVNCMISSLKRHRPSRSYFCCNSIHCHVRAVSRNSHDAIRAFGRLHTDANSPATRFPLRTKPSERCLEAALCAAQTAQVRREGPRAALLRCHLQPDHIVCQRACRARTPSVSMRGIRRIEVITERRAITEIKS